MEFSISNSVFYSYYAITGFLFWFSLLRQLELFLSISSFVTASMVYIFLSQAVVGTRCFAFGELKPRLVEDANSAGVTFKKILFRFKCKQIEYGPRLLQWFTATNWRVSISCLSQKKILQTRMENYLQFNSVTLVDNWPPWVVTWLTSVGQPVAREHTTCEANITLPSPSHQTISVFIMFPTVYKSNACWGCSGRFPLSVGQLV